MTSKSQFYVLGQTGPWIGSIDLIPTGPEGVPKGSQGDPSKPQGVPRDPKAFCNKNKQISWSIRRKLERQISELERQHHFFWKMLKNWRFFTTFCVGAEARAGHYLLPALNSARTPKCKHCLGNNSGRRVDSCSPGERKNEKPSFFVRGFAKAELASFPPSTGSILRCQKSSPPLVAMPPLSFLRHL